MPVARSGCPDRQISAQLRLRGGGIHRNIRLSTEVLLPEHQIKDNLVGEELAPPVVNGFGVLCPCSINLHQRRYSWNCPKNTPSGPPQERHLRGEGSLGAHIPLKNPPSHGGLPKMFVSSCAIFMIAKGGNPLHRQSYSVCGHRGAG